MIMNIYHTGFCDCECECVCVFVCDCRESESCAKQKKCKLNVKDAYAEDEVMK